MRPLPLRLWPILLAALLLASCGGGSGEGGGGGGSAGGGNGGGDPVGDVDNLQPMAVGDSWLYDTTEYSVTQTGWSSSDYLLRVSVTGSQDIAGVPTLVHEFRNMDSGALQFTAYAQKTLDGITQHFPGGALAPVQLLRFPVEEGATYQTYESEPLPSDYDVDGDGRQETIVIRLVVSVGGTESVTVPAGTFANARVITTKRTDTWHLSGGSSSSNQVAQTTEWMVPGIGTVALARTEALPGSYKNTLRYLRSYVVDGQGSDTTPPEVLQSSPTLAGTNNAWTSVSATFSEAVDFRDAQANAAFTLEDALGQPVTGSVSYGPAEFVFTPDAPLATGTYRASLRDVSDLPGNVMPPRTWLFAVDTAQAGDPGDHLPLAVGNRWVYAVTETTSYPWSSQSYQRVETITGTRTLQGHTAYVVQTLDPVSQAVLGEVNLAKSDIALLELFAPGTATGGLPEAWVRARLPFDQPFCYYPSLDRTAVDSGQDLDGDGVHETVSVLVQACVQPDAVTVPAGVFPETRRLNISISRSYTLSGDGRRHDESLYLAEWLAPGVGVVKRTRTESGTSTRYFTYELTGYRVGDLRSETAAPVVTAALPGARTNQPGAGISSTFSEPLDLARASELLVQVVDADGNAVSGNLTLNSQQITFTPGAALPDGSYTVTISNVYDLLGNKLPSHTWTFTLDATAPVVASTTPADGATGVSNFAGIRVRFNEPLGNFGFPVPGPVPVAISGLQSIYDFNYSLNGTDLTISTALLPHDTTYTVTVNAMKDAFGNAMAAPYAFSFTTLPGHLQDLPTRFNEIYSYITATAIGDVDDDGRNDLVIATGSSSVLSNIDAYSLLVFLQKADGTLAAPLKTTTFDYRGYGTVCPATGIGIGDVSGDGKTDIVLGETYCGIQVFERQADGTWPRPPVLASTRAGALRLADLDGDGRLDAVGQAGDGKSLGVWYQQAGGGLGSETTVSLPFTINSPYFNYGSALVTGDVTGDGRTDVVLKTSGALAVLPRAAAGGFDAPVYYGSGSAQNPPQSVAVGDLNQDGRQDVAISVSSNAIGSQVGVFAQQADGSLAAVTYTPTRQHPYALYVLDADGDGRNDLLAGTDISLGLHLQDSTGTLTAEDRYSGGNVIAVGDLNGDGRPDVVSDVSRKLHIRYNTGH